ncbi:Cytochrome P450 87A3 [Dichanthelium oligosanthes]|uniref:Cytochrome P450 87A3 n=1 Tax=Dichanthelium oligosanthes TaxID=888268 RepID=A0A1E5VHF1_9POAL|nr:Cytochrome P450 87A3 [Dichanthelium oligosanthes]
MEISLVPFAALCGVTLMIGWLLHRVYKWINPPCNGILPPGSMGFPVIEVNRFIFQQEGKLFQSWYPETAITIFGKKSVDEFNGALHKFVRIFASKLFGLEYLKKELLPELENTMRENFAEWATKPSIETHDGPADVMFDLVAKKLIGLDSTKSRELRKNYNMFLQGLISFPIYFPGTTLYRCMQKRKNIQKIMSDLLRQRLSTSTKKYGDLLDLIVEELQREKPTIDENFAKDMLVGLLFNSFVTVGPILTLAFKFLNDNPKALEALKDEHEALIRNRENADSRFTWEEYKSLTFTMLVVNELTRMSNITPGIFRKTLTDVQVNGYTIPAGWMVIMIPIASHLSPEIFDDPLKFNPWRWLVCDEYPITLFFMITFFILKSPKTQESSKQTAMLENFVPFGLGIRACPATEFSKLFIALFLHVLVTKYRWKEIKGGEVCRKAVIMFPKGYQIQLLPRA